MNALRDALRDDAAVLGSLLDELTSTSDQQHKGPDREGSN